MPAPTSPHPASGRPLIPARRPTVRLALDAAARIGSVVTLAALLVVTGMLLTMLDAPVPTAAATAGR